MTTTKFTLILAAGLVMLAVSPVAAQAQAMPAAPDVRADPYVPPAKRLPSPQAPSSGAALQQQAMQKLRLRFDEADIDKDGRLTQDEARRAGFGFVAAHFSLIDTDKRGYVQFDELVKFMQHLRKEAVGRRG